jgi:hypothetical protein
MSDMEFPAWNAEEWQDLPQNPLIHPVEKDRPGAVIGDPQVILPGEFDGRWHLFAYGSGHFYRFDSLNGLDWTLIYDDFWNSGPSCVTCDGRKWIACFSQHNWPVSSDSVLCARTSTDLVRWSDPVELLVPDLDWEREGRVVQVRNPNLLLLPDGRFRLYYCGGTVWMEDMNFEEPKYVSFADSDDPLGPYAKHGKPVCGPDPAKPYRSYGSGAMKVFRYEDRFLGLMNGLYIDKDNHSRSAIDVLMSDDGIRWQDAPYNPIIAPSGEGWKKALVYQLDLRMHESKLWLFYNGRAGWPRAKECIGCSTLTWSGPPPLKMWRLPRMVQD